MAKAKKKHTVKVAPAKAEKVEVKTEGLELKFVARDNSVTTTITEPVKGNMASDIVIAVAKALSGKLPARCKQVFAPSYKGHYISLGNKNAVGWFDHKNLLVVNGLADQLEKEGVKGIITPTSKPYKGLMVGGMDSKERASLVGTIVRVLKAEGIAPVKKAKAKAKVETTVVAPATA